MIRGPLTYQYNFFTRIRFGTSCKHLVTQIRRAESMQGIKRIIFLVDSPVGWRKGVEEVADAIFNCKLDTLAYVDSLAGSGALWLATQCDQFVPSRSSVSPQKLRKEFVFEQALFLCLH